MKKGAGENDEAGRGARLAARSLAAYVRLVRSTSRLNDDFSLLERKFDEHAPLIIAGWHGTFLLAPTLMPRPERFSAVVARHGDAEIMGLLLQEFGISLIRGAGAGGKKKDKGGAYALRAALRELKSGRSIAMTADVPPGPARRVGPGVIMLARLSGRPVLPVAAISSRFLVLNTWSRFIVNLPFSRLALLAGEPLYAPRGASEAELEELRLELERRIEELNQRGHALTGSNPDRCAAPRVGQPPRPGLVPRLYGAGMNMARIAAPFVLARRAARGKEDMSRIAERYGKPSIARPTGPLAWLHAASVGETNAILPLVEAMREKWPQMSVLLTTVTTTSARIARSRLPEGAFH
jgi:3-deoxy-D-manno-octulosonic-acid transferase